VTRDILRARYLRADFSRLEIPSSGTAAGGSTSSPNSSVGGPSTGSWPVSSPVPPRGWDGASPGSRSNGGIAPTGSGWPEGVVAAAGAPGVAGAPAARVASCGEMLPRKGWPVAYCASAGTDAAKSRPAARAPAALILWQRGKDAYPRSKPGRGKATPRVHPAVDRESLGAIELTGRLGPSRNGNVLDLTGP